MPALGTPPSLSWDLLCLRGEILFSSSNNNHSLLPNAPSQSCLRSPATPTRLNSGSKVPVAALSGRSRIGARFAGRTRCPRSPREDTGSRGGPLHVRRPRVPEIARLQGLQWLSYCLPQALRSPRSSLRPAPRWRRTGVHRAAHLARPGPLAAP